MSVIGSYWRLGGQIIGWLLAWALLVIVIGVLVVLDGLVYGNGTAVQDGLELILIGFLALFIILLLGYLVFAVDHLWNWFWEWARTNSLPAAKALLKKEAIAGWNAVKKGIGSVVDTIDGWVGWLRKKLG